MAQSRRIGTADAAVTNVAQPTHAPRNHFEDGHRRVTEYPAIPITAVVALFAKTNTLAGIGRELHIATNYCSCIVGGWSAITHLNPSGCARPIGAYG